MTHTHFCIGKCGTSVTCNGRVVRDDCGAHCEDEDRFVDFECDDCRETREAAEDHADAVAEDGSHVV